MNAVNKIQNQPQAPQNAGVKKPTKAWQEAQEYRNMINEGRECVIADDLSTVVYLYDDAMGRPAAIGYRGRAKKPTIRNYYVSVEFRKKHIDGWMQEIKKNIEAKKSVKTVTRTLQLRDILVCSWGFAQESIKNIRQDLGVNPTEKQLQLVLTGSTILSHY